MTDFDWRDFLQKWSRAILVSPTGFEPATEDQITAAEARLGVTLPPSYRAFLKVSNGWRHTGSFITRILPVEEIHWLRDSADALLLENIAAFVAAFDDEAPEFDPVDYRHFNATLLIAEPSEEYELYVLNPQVKSAEGEWQAWSFAEWHPGADAYASFQALLEAEYASLLYISQYETARLTPQDSPVTIAGKLPLLIKQIEDDLNAYSRGNDDPAFAVQSARIDGMREVLDRVSALQSADPAALRAQLQALIEEYDPHPGLTAQAQQQAAHELLQGLGPLKSAADLDSLFTKLIAGQGDLMALLGPMMQFNEQAMKQQGHKQAVGRIRHFLK